METPCLDVRSSIIEKIALLRWNCTAAEMADEILRVVNERPSPDGTAIRRALQWLNPRAYISPEAAEAACAEALAELGVLLMEKGKCCTDTAVTGSVSRPPCICDNYYHHSVTCLEGQVRALAAQSKFWRRNFDEEQQRAETAYRAKAEEKRT